MKAASFRGDVAYFSLDSLRKPPKVEENLYCSKCQLTRRREAIDNLTEFIRLDVHRIGSAAHQNEDRRPDATMGDRRIECGKCLCIPGAVIQQIPVHLRNHAMRADAGTVDDKVPVIGLKKVPNPSPMTVHIIRLDPRRSRHIFRNELRWTWPRDAFVNNDDHGYHTTTSLRQSENNTQRIVCLPVYSVKKIGPT